MVSDTSYNDLFRDYYYTNKGTFYKSFEFSVNNILNSYDIYWGDPNIIFSEKDRRETFPLAIMSIPQRANTPNPRIFLHEKLGKSNSNVFEMVIAHEIGHFWLHDIVGINHQKTNTTMPAYEVEIWSDYFAFCFFTRFRNIKNIDDFKKILIETFNFTIETYSLNPSKSLQNTHTSRINDLITLDKKVKSEIEKSDPFTIHMMKAIELTLDSIGDVFKE